MKHQTATLEGALLDAAVAKAEGLTLRTEPHGFPMWCRADGSYEQGGAGDFSTRWSLAGPIIERERIAVYFQTGEDADNDFENEWVAGIGLSLETTPNYESCGGFPFIDFDHSAAGPTPLIAAMRAYVCAKLGAEVEL